MTHSIIHQQGQNAIEKFHAGNMQTNARTENF